MCTPRVLPLANRNLKGIQSIHSEISPRPLHETHKGQNTDPKTRKYWKLCLVSGTCFWSELNMHVEEPEDEYQQRIKSYGWFLKKFSNLFLNFLCKRTENITPFNFLSPHPSLTTVYWKTIKWKLLSIWMDEREIFIYFLMCVSLWYHRQIR